MGKIAQESTLLELLYALGRPKKANPGATVAIAITSTKVINANKNRKSLILTNIGANPIHIGIGEAAVANQGIYLVSGGGCWEMNNNTFSTLQIYAIAIGSTSTISIQEFE